MYRWAHRRRGDAAAVGYLALGHAYLVAGRDRHAISAFRLAAEHGSALGDFNTYFLAKAQIGARAYGEAAATLWRFGTKYPRSILAAFVPALRASAFLDENHPADALRVLLSSAGGPIGDRAKFQLALAQAYLALGQRSRALLYFRRVFTEYPLSSEADAARRKISSMDLLHTLPPADLRINADALYHAGRYRTAKEEYLLLGRNRRLSEGVRNAYFVAAAACDLHLNRLTQHEIDMIRDLNDDAGARLLYLNVQLARNRGNDQQIRQLINELERKFPHSRWLARALYSAGNMYLLKPDYPKAISYYSELSQRFPYMCRRNAHRDDCSDFSAKSHWRAAWLTYRLGHYQEAAHLFDTEIKRYPGSAQFSTALYWRGRIYEREHKDRLAAAYYRTVIRLYPHYYNALIAKKSLKAMGPVRPAAVPALDRINPTLIPDFSDKVPQDNRYVEKARLLANAGLGGYVSSEINAAPGSREWAAFAEAKIFAHSDEAWRAMFALMRVVPYYTQVPMGAIPMAYWRILYPTPYWSTILRYSRLRGLNPYMVASLIRQESGFRPDAVSSANAWGLMQLLPSVGRTMARKAGLRYFHTRDLLNPTINIELGTLYLKQLVDEFDGNTEYAFAAYNAGDYRVRAWQQIGHYDGMPEFVESIPFSQTHNYVESIVRNEQMYRVIKTSAREQASARQAEGRTVRK